MPFFTLPEETTSTTSYDFPRQLCRQQPIRRHRQPCREVPRWELLVRLPAPVVLKVERVAHRVVPKLQGCSGSGGRVARPPPAPPDPSDEAAALVPDLRTERMI
ncbi:hypothetical protein EUGRSUZ_C01623 [Eucalyptus grandis]|uniref:Uncharacterized protein n=2 Tax=Eucalyptus grandis TaxID=71139 RepID=A0ACC3LFZ5_EUCGR|nr:hypothetical protein EUGRSUZ_C01623 [Eucalyptus grandis]